MELARVLEIALGNASAALVLAVAVALVGMWLRRPAVLHLLWLVVLVRLLMPPVLEIPLLTGEPSPLTHASVVTAPAADGAAVSGLALAEPPSALGLRETLLLGWLVGAAALVLLAAARTLRLVRTVRAGTRPDLELHRRLEGLSRAMGVRPPELRLVAGQLPPMVWGLPSHPVLILPESLRETLFPDELDAVLAHELAHLRRRDHWARFLELAAVVLFWWNPASWWASGGLRAAEEECCDALVMRQCPGSGTAYARGLVKTMGFLAGADTLFPTVVTGASHFRRLDRRIRVIMSAGSVRALSAPLWAALAALVVGALVIAPTMAARPVPAGSPPAAESETSRREPITMTLDRAVLEEVLGTLASVAELNLVVDSRVTVGSLNARVSGEYRNVPWESVLGDVLQQGGLTWTVEGAVLWVHLAGQGPTVRLGYTGEPITLDLQSADLRAVLSTIGKLTGTELVVDPEVSGTVTVSFVDVPWDQALDFILAVNGCSWSSENGVIRVFPDPGQGRVPSAVELPQSPPRPVSTVDGECLFRFVRGGAITEPVRVHAPQPAYTAEARDARIQGAVVLQLVIGAEGRVTRAEVVRGLPLGLTESALETVRGWRFEPATFDGVPVAVEYVVAVRFRLDEAPQLP